MPRDPMSPAFLGSCHDAKFKLCTYSTTNKKTIKAKLFAFMNESYSFPLYLLF